jgi:hypothetical protein
MKTEARKGKEAGCAPGRKKHRTGEAGGRPSWRSSFLGDPGAQFFCRKRWRSFAFYFSSLAEPVAAARSGQGRAVFPARAHP